MTDSLKDQLLKLGFKSAPSAPVQPKEKSAPQRANKPGDKVRHGSNSNQNTPHHSKSNANHQNATAHQNDIGNRGRNASHQNNPKRQQNVRSQEEMDLARAYAMRAKTEREEKEQAAQAAQALAQANRERKLKLTALLQNKALNLPEVDLVRHFSHREKIRRVHVDAAQLAALNRGDLVVLFFNGRYLLVDVPTAEAARAIHEACVALWVDPNEPPTDDVPADLIW